MTVTTTRYLISTKPVLDLCTSCGAPVLSAHAEGIPVVVDVTPVHRRGELLTVTEGRSCYALTAAELVHRDPHRLTRAAAVVLPEHRCGDPVEPERRTAWPPAKTDVSSSDETTPPW